MSMTEFAKALSDTWAVSPEEFPAKGTPEEKLRFLVQYAVLAPSSHNTQPWKFHICPDYVELYADRTRALPVVDPDDRELIISCGAALFHLCIAIRHFGYEDDTELLPDPDNADLLARVRIGGYRTPTDIEHKLFYAITARHTNRLPFFEREVSEATLKELETAAEQQGAWLHVMRSAEDRKYLAKLISEGDRMQWSDKRFRRELAAWVHPNRSESKDGIPGYAMGMNSIMSMAGPLVVRTFDLGNGRAARDLELATGSPVLAVLATRGDTMRDWLKVGEALARVLLRAAAEGVSASFLNQPIEIPKLRGITRKLLGTPHHPQIVLRMGYAPEVQRTPRRPVDEVLTY